MDKNTLLEILLDWNYWGHFKTRLKNRPVYLERMEKLLSAKTALTILGIRRSGKSSLIHLFLQEKFATNELQINDTLILNLEDPRFRQPVTSVDLNRMWEIYLKEVNPERPLVILDEVQNVDGWERFARFLMEAKGVQVIVTGSSSKLLDSEISTSLTGRHVDMEVFPLSFVEWLSFKGMYYRTNLEITRARLEIQRMLDEYLRWGGFPEVSLALTTEHKRELLLRYFDDILFKDIVKRYRIHQVNKLEQLSLLLLTNTSTLQSMNRLKNQLNLSLDTVERFIEYLKNSRIFLFLRKFDYSLGKQMRSIYKAYIADTGFYFAKGFRFSDNIGRLVENLVLIELNKKRLNFPDLEIFYWKDAQQREVDFVVKQNQRVNQLIQVSWNLEDEQTLKREVRSLLKAGVLLNCDNLIIINENLEEEREYDYKGENRTIRFIPLWKWLLL